MYTIDAPTNLRLYEFGYDAEASVRAAHESGGVNPPGLAWVVGFIDRPNSKIGQIQSSVGLERLTQ
ncbi:MAG: hypothetical protein ABSA52_07960 [Candidatus Binatia bacterium]